MTDPSAAIARAEAALADGRTHEAEGICLDVLAAVPGHLGAMALRGAAILARGDAGGALALLRAAAVPGAPAPWFHNLRNACRQLHLHGEAATAARAALAQAPEHPELLFALGQSLAEAGQPAAAQTVLAAAVARRPDRVGWHLLLAHALLAAGQWQEGWQEYEWRLQALTTPLAGAPGPAWDGQALPGQTIAAISEQGAGDALQFARFLPLAAARCGGVAVACQPALAPLLRAIPGVAACVGSIARLPPAAAHITFGSLPRLFAATPDNLPAPPYLQADPVRVARWRDRLGPGRRIGLVWAGNPAYALDARRSLRLTQLRPLLAAPGARFVSLQKDVPEADRAMLADSGILDTSAGLTDFAETAAVIACLDLVIGVDTAVTHLAGAMGRNVWFLLMEPAEWRWLRGRDDTPWYPQARLFRQTAPGDWDSVAARAARALT